ncbi:DUF1796 family putative cysteine peptidase [Roseomonas sp. CAU 1739]|uniref:DUF1796 family putative cysteine peptidase n=1 Tax=Roseomonas sp. CAU 1739 TaxID=3140364 RepID=UPI00325BFE57
MFGATLDRLPMACLWFGCEIVANCFAAAFCRETNRAMPGADAPNIISPLWLSLGENCLPDDILSRHGKKAFSSPYISGRSNIDHAIELEKRDNAGLLDAPNLMHMNYLNAKVVRSKTIVHYDDIFEETVSNGFEFTHHDPLSRKPHREAIERRIQRLLAARGRDNIVFLYHHRISDNSDISRLRCKIREFREFYQSDTASAIVAIFYQNIIPKNDENRLEIKIPDDGILEYVFHTHAIWSGNNPAIFWVRCDDDLIRSMIDDIAAYAQPAPALIA